jgi:phosphotransferase system HPr-like phosphotransfer protein
MSKIVKKLEIKNKLGVHARAAALLVQDGQQVFCPDYVLGG